MYTSSNRRSSGSVLAAFIFLFSVTTVSAFEGDASNGKKLFKSNCASCHKLDKKLIGPALTGVTDKYSEEWLLAWIRNNAELRASGDADAIAIFEEYNGSVMSAFPSLSDQDIFDILQYTIEGDKKPVPPGGDLAGGTTVVVEGKNYDSEITIGLGILLFLMVMPVSYTHLTLPTKA